jgi:hypothetical protein
MRWPPRSVPEHSTAPFTYRPDILEALHQYGVRPSEHTPPAVVHEFVSDLYRFEIRRLRSRLLQKEFPKREYAARVVQLRMRYKIISLRPDEWILT